MNYQKKQKEEVIIMNNFNYDSFGEVINGKETYNAIARALKNYEAIGIGWTDEKYTHLDIIFKLGITKIGYFQRGIRDYYLYVSIIGHNSFAFIPDTIKEGNYIQARMNMEDSCGDKLAELVNGVIESLNNG